jgi:hypothetical protein
MTQALYAHMNHKTIKIKRKKEKNDLVVVAHTSNQQGKEDEAGGSQAQGQPGLHLLGAAG